jgi:tetratricopeptide (TPR) repeat protein
MLQKLLTEPRLAERADLWRLAAQLAEKRDQTARALEYLERALDAEFRHPPTVINLKEVRRDYEKLLEHYQKLADAMTVLKVRPPADFAARVVRTADRWRALDRDGTAACQAAARILQTLGETDLVWDYLTTPVALQPGESAPWLNLAQALSRKGELELADRAFHAAFEAEPTNAQVLWDRAQGLLHAGKRAEAGQVFRQLAEGKWQPRFNWIQTQARRQMENP